LDIRLYEFIAAHRAEITDRCKAKVDRRLPARPSTAESDHGVPVFVSQLINALRLGLTSPEIAATALLHGQHQRLQGFSVSHVVYDYGDVCQCVTELAVEREANISANDFRLFSLCLDNAMAAGVTAYERGKT
jgi:hypothetical protein